MTLNLIFIFAIFTQTSLESRELQFQLVLHSSKDKFEKSKSEEEWLPQIDGQMTFSYSREVTIQKVKSREATTRDRVKYVPGQDDGGIGHSWMKLEEIKGKPILQLSSALVRLKKSSYPNVFPKKGDKTDRLKEGDDYGLIRQTARYELEWVKGSWSEFQNGEDVELRFSKSGTQEFLIDFRRQVAREIWAALLKMKGQDAPNPEGTIWIKTLKKNKEESLDYRGRIRGNRDRFEIDWIPVQVDVTAKVQCDPSSRPSLP